jgi:hypothetical protein
MSSSSSSSSSSEDRAPSRVVRYLWLGGKAHAKDRELLRRLGVTHVVNCSPPRR